MRVSAEEVHKNIKNSGTTKYIFKGKEGTHAEKITVTIELNNSCIEQDAWDILEGFSKFNFAYWDLERIPV